MTDRRDDANKPFEEGGVTSLHSSSGAVRTFSPGQLIDNKYKLQSLLGKGGMGIVFSCHHIGLSTQYAIKILSAEEMTEDSWSRFEAEAKILATLKHPGIVAVYNMGIEGGQFPYYVMDLLDGEPLDQLIDRQGTIKIDKTLQIFIRVADALDAAHAKGVIHRDIKPSNLMLLDESGAKSALVKIVDFGIARLSRQNFAAQSQTKTGAIMGTPFYMSPEQCQGLIVDARSDVYSFGCTMFKALTGNVPIRGENAFQTYMMHQSTVAPTLASACSEKAFPDSLEVAIAKMLAKDPADRYQTMAQLKHDLERIKAGKAVIGQEITTSIDAPQRRKTLIMESGPVGSKRLALAKGILLAIVALAILAGGGFTTSQLFKKPTTAKVVSLPYQGFDTFIPHTPADQALVGNDPVDFADAENTLRDQTKKYLADPKTAKRLFKVSGPQPGFQFPDDFNLAAIRFGNDEPIMAKGFVPIPKGKHICVYFYQNCQKTPWVIRKFGPNDINGLEIVTMYPSVVFDTLRDWHAIDELSFFNTLIKAPAGPFQDFEESTIIPQHLAVLDHLPTLRSIGVCGPTISGGAIAKTEFFKRVNTLKINRIADIDQLLAALPARDNLQELWLINVIDSDSQLNSLTKMSNLHNLRIRRSKLTPNSLKYFQSMKSLKSLWLDVDWPKSERTKFGLALAQCKFEPSIDRKFWQSPELRNTK